MQSSALSFSLSPTVSVPLKQLGPDLAKIRLYIESEALAPLRSILDGYGVAPEHRSESVLRLGVGLSLGAPLDADKVIGMSAYWKPEPPSQVTANLLEELLRNHGKGTSVASLEIDCKRLNARLVELDNMLHPLSVKALGGIALEATLRTLYEFEISEAEAKLMNSALIWHIYPQPLRGHLESLSWGRHGVDHNLKYIAWYALPKEIKAYLDLEESMSIIVPKMHEVTRPRMAEDSSLETHIETCRQTVLQFARTLAEKRSANMHWSEQLVSWLKAL